MSAMGRASKIEGVLNKGLDAGPLIPVNKLNNFKYYCPNCYSFNLYYREVEPEVFDITCLDCNKHWIKVKKTAKMQ